ncbi:spore coat U domain-containing protein [Variovorax sp. VNK109]|uniref:Csu type fimbrial protein n=1 Tax=Variovorax sp. VNK109 TaxID=3400919 RepID=UPI003C111778
MNRINPVSKQVAFNRALKAAFLSAGVLLACAPAAHAVTATTTFQVTASVVKACLVTTPPTLGFGTYDPNSSTPLNSTTTFYVTCTSGTPYSIGMSPGVSSGASVTTRRMTSASAAAGSNTLSYGLYKDAAHTVNWDNSTAATGYSGNGTAQPLTVYGQIPVNQYTAAPATDYTDTITLTLTY